MLLVDADAVERINAIDERLTLATLPPFRAVEAGEMVGTVKVIPFAVEGAVLDAAVATFSSPAAAASRAYRPRRIGVVSTLLPGLKPSVVAKTLRVLEDRLAPTGLDDRRRSRGCRTRPAPSPRLSCDSRPTTTC